MEEYEKRQVTDIQAKETLYPEIMAIEITYLVLTIIIFLLGLISISIYGAMGEEGIDVILFGIAMPTVFTISLIPTILYGYIIGMLVKIRKLQIQNSKKIKGQLIPIVGVGIGISIVILFTFFTPILFDLVINTISYYILLISIIGAFVLTGAMFYVINKIKEKGEEKENKKYWPIKITPLMNSTILLVAFGVYLAIRYYKDTLEGVKEELLFVIISAVIYSITSSICQGILLARKIKRNRERKERSVEQQVIKG